jgi:hypothetical protein
MDGSSPKGRGLRVQRGWKINRMAGQFQSDAYRLAAPPPPAVTIAMPPPHAPSLVRETHGGAGKIEKEMFCRQAAGGRS